eukprot:s1047_g1.t4
MAGNQAWSSEGTVWYRDPVTALWNQLDAVNYQLEQSNQQLCLQQNLIFGLQQQHDADQNRICKLVDKLLEHECSKAKSPAAEPRSAEEPLEAKGGSLIFAARWRHPCPAERQCTQRTVPSSREDRSDTNSTDAGSAGSDQEDADWIFVHDASEASTESVPPTPAALWLRLSACQDQRGDHSCDVPEGCPVAPTTPLRTAQRQQTPDEPPKKSPCRLSTAAPDDSDDSDQELEDCRSDASFASEDAQDGGRQSGGDRQVWPAAASTPILDKWARRQLVEALVKPEDADQHFCIDEGRSAGTREGRADAACQTDDDDCTVCDTLLGTSGRIYHSATDCAGECTPSDLHVAELLPYLTVRELLIWRLLSRRTSNHEALIAHVAEMGSMDRPGAIYRFAEQVNTFLHNPGTSFMAAFERFGGTAIATMQQKHYEGRLWCKALASKTRTHFPTHHGRRIVKKHLQCLFEHFCHSNLIVSEAAAFLLHFYGRDALPYVQELMAHEMLRVLEDLATSYYEAIPANITQIGQCMGLLGQVLPSLTVSQRQKWMMLILKVMFDHGVANIHKELFFIKVLKMLWEADDEPTKTYAEARRQLRILSNFCRGELQSGLLALIN